MTHAIIQWSPPFLCSSVTISSDSVNEQGKVLSWTSIISPRIEAKGQTTFAESDALIGSAWVRLCLRQHRNGLMMPAVGSGVGTRQQAHCVFAKPGLDRVTVGQPAYQRIPCQGLGILGFPFHREEGSGEGGILPKSKNRGSSNACELLLCEASPHCSESRE